MTAIWHELQPQLSCSHCGGAEWAILSFVTTCFGTWLLQPGHYIYSVERMYVDQAINNHNKKKKLYFRPITEECAGRTTLMRLTLAIAIAWKESYCVLFALLDSPEYHQLHTHIPLPSTIATVVHRETAHHLIPPHWTRMCHRPAMLYY